MGVGIGVQSLTSSISQILTAAATARTRVRRGIDDGDATDSILELALEAMFPPA